MKITIQTTGHEFSFVSQTGVYLETPSFAFFWPCGGRPVLSRKTSPALA